MTLKYFTDPALLVRLDNCLFTQFLGDYKDCLPPEAVALFATQFNSPDDWWAAWAALFTTPTAFGPDLLGALIDIDTLARPENSVVLEDAIRRPPPEFNISRQRGALYQAMYLRLIVKRHSDVSWPLPPHAATDAPLGPPTSPSANPPSTAAPSTAAPTTAAPTTAAPPTDAPATDPQPSTDPAPETESQTFSRLARLPATEYDKTRRSEAKRLHLRLKTLDAEVDAARAQLQAGAEADGVQLPKIEPWPEPITDPPSLFDEVSARFTCHISLPPGAADAITMWDACTHVFHAFRISPRLNLFSATGGCGKTTTLDVLATMCPRPLRTENMRPAVLFRVVDRYEPVLLLDEFDSYTHDRNELRGLINAGHKFDGCAIRCEGPGKSFRHFKAFAPAALAGIGELPATLRDRSILIPLVEAKPGEVTEPFNPDHAEVEHTLGRKIARWARDNFDAIKACKPKMPPGAHNRRADNWRPLFAIAQVIGGHWPDRLLEAYQKLTAKPQLADTDSALLADVRQIFTDTGATRMFSSTLVQALRLQPNRPYNQPLKPNGPPPLLTEAWLARRMSAFGIRSRTIRVGPNRARGYDRADILRAT